PGRCIAGRRARRGRLRGGPGRSARWCVRAAARQEDSRRSVHRLSMPFTPSHAVVALPFVRTPLVPAAIAIGAMTPDLPLFLRGFGVSYSFTHTLTNLLWTSVIAAVLFLLWRAVLRPAMPELSPAWLARRLPEDWDASPGTSLRQALGAGESRRYAPMLVLSLLLGVASHIGWDLFTHAGRAGVELIPVLAEQWGPLQGFKWLQHGSSVLGLVVLGVWA